jgi:3-oxosteroid 1-dehydrogenase
LRVRRCEGVEDEGYPDYYPDRPGGSADGRGIEGAVFDGRKLGPWLDKLLVNPNRPPVPPHTPEVSKFALMARTPRAGA